MTRVGQAALHGLTVLVAGAVLAGGTMAATCDGTLQTSLLHPLPAKVTVVLEPSPDDAVNPQLARRFASGLQAAGVALSPQGTMTLNLAVSVTAQTAGGSNAVSGTYKGFDWVSGEQVPGRPAAIRSASLTLTATLADNVQYTQSWVAALQCNVVTDDSGQLAQDLGEVIGRNIGTHFGAKRF